MSNENTPKLRPYWYVDLKWISGLLLVIVLSILLIVYCLVLITSEEMAIDALSIGLASAYSLEKGLDDEEEINAIKKQMNRNSEKTVNPIPGLPITVTEEDLNNLSAKEIRIYIFRQIAEPIYYGKTDSFAIPSEEGFKADTELIDRLGFLSFITKSTNEKLKSLLFKTIIIAFILLIPLIFFSYRFGKLISLGVILIIVSLPGSIIYSLLNFAFAINNSYKPPGTEASTFDMLNYIGYNALPPIVDRLTNIFLLILLAGIIFLLIAFIGNKLWKMSLKIKENKTVA